MEIKMPPFARRTAARLAREVRLAGGAFNVAPRSYLATPEEREWRETGEFRQGRMTWAEMNAAEALWRS